MPVELKRSDSPSVQDEQRRDGEPEGAPNAAPVASAPEVTETPSSSQNPLRQGVSWLLSLPLFYKVLIANSAIVLLGALGGTFITLRVAAASRGQALDVPLAAMFALCGLLLTVSLNALILRAAFTPLDQLQEAVLQVREGDLSVRATRSPLADVEIARIADTLNSMLDDVQHYEQQVQALSGGLIRAQEEERQRIARELHDDTGQVLTLLLIRLKLLEAQPGSEALTPQIEELRGLVSSAIDQVRRLALNLRPPTLDQLGLWAALRSLVATFTESTHVDVKLDLPREQAHFSPERTIAIYRVVQEALTNIAKHSNAKHVTVEAQTDDRELRVTIRDDGKGFTSSTVLNPARRDATSGAGIGLFGMEERARLAGGTLRVQSAPGRGSVVELRVPVETPATGRQQ